MRSGRTWSWRSAARQEEGALYLAHLLELLGQGVVMSVDLDRSEFEVAYERIQAVTGRSDDPEVVETVRRGCEGKRVLVIHDTGHSKAQVLADLALYAPLVTVSSHLIVEDGIVDLSGRTTESDCGRKSPWPRPSNS